MEGIHVSVVGVWQQQYWITNWTSGHLPWGPRGPTGASSVPGSLHFRQFLVFDCLQVCLRMKNTVSTKACPGSNLEKYSFCHLPESVDIRASTSHQLFGL